MTNPRCLIDYERRKAEWLKATGLRESNARHMRVLPWLDKYTLPDGFDHTRVYYYPKGKFHILITEPYHNVLGAFQSISDLSRERSADLAREDNTDFAWEFGGYGVGLWYPCNCFAMLVAKKEHGKLLKFFTERLPK